MTAKPPRRSIVASFGALSTAPPAKPEAEEIRPGPALVSPRVPAGVIGATQRSLGDMREENDRLRAQLAAGGAGAGATEIDPALIDPSPFPDRLRDDDGADFEAFKKSFSEEGQQIPIQVRRHPQVEGRYQTVFGHRRLRAARELGKTVRALVRDLTDRELVIAQGIENGERQDLTWIERALFASRMEAAGVKPRDIKGALSIDDAELARMRSVWRALPADLLEKIGRAPRVGRPRWVDLAAAISRTSGSVSMLRKTLSSDKVSTLSSDERFQIALQAMRPAAASESAEMSLTTSAGQRVGTATFARDAVRLSVDKAHSVAFAAFMRDELPALVDRFLASKGGSPP